MKCDEAMESASAALDGALEEEQRASLIAHLGACAGCRERSEQLNALRGLLRGMEEQEESPAGRAGFPEFIAKAAAGREKNRVNTRAAKLAAETFLGLVVVAVLVAYARAIFKSHDRTGISAPVAEQASPEKPAPVSEVQPPDIQPEKPPDPLPEKPPPPPPDPPKDPIRVEDGQVDLEATDRAVCEALLELFKTYPGTVTPEEITEPKPGRFVLKLTYEGTVDEKTDKFQLELGGFSKKYPKKIRGFSTGYQVQDKPAK